MISTSDGYIKQVLFMIKIRRPLSQFSELYNTHAFEHSGSLCVGSVVCLFHKMIPLIPFVRI